MIYPGDVTGGGELRVTKTGTKLKAKGKLGKLCTKCHVYSGNVHICHAI